LQEPLLQACRKFYADTASFGARPAIECGRAFFGVDRLLFATDMPFDPGQGRDYIHATLAAIASMDLTAKERKQVLWENARRLFKLNGRLAETWSPQAAVWRKPRISTQLFSPTAINNVRVVGDWLTGLKQSRPTAPALRSMARKFPGSGVSENCGQWTPGRHWNFDTRRLAD
jgi:hypothetical protein